MKDQELVNALREHAEWARANEWETPITLGDDLVEAADRIANQNTHILALQKEIEKLRGHLRHLCRNCDLDRLKKLAEADRAGRLLALPCKVGDTVYYWDGCQIIDYKVESFSVFDGNVWLMYGVHREKRNGIVFGKEFWAHEFYCCKTVFLTREEAKAALEAMKDE